MQKIGIYGIGYFGYALLKHLDQKKSYNLCAYDRSAKLRESLIKKGVHIYFHKSHKISSNISIVNSPQELISNDLDVLILAVSSDATLDVCRKIKPHLKHPYIIVNTAKALDKKSGARLSVIVTKFLGNKIKEYALLAGGTIAHDLFEHQPLGATIACEDKKIAFYLKSIFQSDNLTIYPSTDLVGTEYAAAFKNVIAILAGIIKGMGFSYGSETHIISRAAYEIENLIINHLGGKKETFSTGSQCWGNDLWMSCTGDTRNKKFGILLGKGLSFNKARKQMLIEHQTIEGLNTLMVLSSNKTLLKKTSLLKFLVRITKNKAKVSQLPQIIQTRL